MRQEEGSDSILMRGMRWLADKTIRKIINKFGQNDVTNKNNDRVASCLKFPFLNVHCQYARNFALEKVRNKNKQIIGKDKNVRDKIENQIEKQNNKKDLPNSLEAVNKFWIKKISPSEKPMEMVCPICLDFCVEAVTTPCGHSFCYPCIDESILLNPNCPVCRTFIRGQDLISSKELNSVITSFIKKYEVEEELENSLVRLKMESEIITALDENPYYQNYRKRVMDFRIWLSKRNIDSRNLKPSDLIDVRDTENIWCKCIVQQIFKQRNQITAVLVHYIGWNSIYDEIIEIYSQRLANYKFYSHRKDIPHYDLSENNHDHFNSYVIVENELAINHDLNIMNQSDSSEEDQDEEELNLSIIISSESFVVEEEEGVNVTFSDDQSQDEEEQEQSHTLNQIFETSECEQIQKQIKQSSKCYDEGDKQKYQNLEQKSLFQGKIKHSNPQILFFEQSQS